MVMVKLYIEGAGQDRPGTHAMSTGVQHVLRIGWVDDQTPPYRALRGTSVRLRCICDCGENRQAGDLPLLLVDAEEGVAEGQTVWQHLKSRDNWDKPSGAGDDQAFLMVQVMETWFLADREMLHAYFGPEFAERHLHAWPSLEDVPKQTVYDALKQATADCKQKYAKGKVSFELLAKVDPGKVENSCPHGKVFLERMRRL